MIDWDQFSSRNTAAGLPKRLICCERVTVRGPGPPSLTNVHSQQPYGARSRELSQHRNLFKGSFRLLCKNNSVRGNQLYYLSCFVTVSLVFQKLLVSLVKTPLFKRTVSILNPRLFGGLMLDEAVHFWAAPSLSSELDLHKRYILIPEFSKKPE